MNDRFSYVTKNSETGDIERIDVRFDDFNSGITLEGDKKLSSFSNFSNANANSDGGIQASHYGSLFYRNIYEGVDLKFYLYEGDLRYDFLVNEPDAAGNIQFSIEGSDKISVNTEKELKIETSFGMITNSAPVSYQVDEQNQKREIIHSEYLVENQSVSFHLQNYDPNRPLVIDPKVTYSTYFGGANNDLGQATATDGTNIYIAGFTASTQGDGFPITSGVHQETKEAAGDGFIAKFNKTGDTLLWSTYYGGNNDDQVNAMCYSSDASALFVAGTSQADADELQTAGLRAHNNGKDGFVARFDASNGTRDWGTYWGGNNSDDILDLDCESGGIVVTGFTNSADFPTSTGVVQENHDNSNEILAAKFDASDGTNIWSTYYGGGDADEASGVVTDGSGNVIIIGTTDGNGFPAVGTFADGFGNSHNGNNDAVIIKLNSDATSTEWARYYGGSQKDIGGGLDPASKNTTGSEFGKGIDVDPDNNIYFTGNTVSDDFPTSNAAFGTRDPNGEDLFITKFTPAGETEWSTYYGGNNNDYAIDVEYSNVCDQLYFSGDIQSTDLDAQGKLLDPFQSSFGGGSYDSMLGSFSTDGTFTFASYYGGGDNDYSRDIEEIDNKIIIIGKTTSEQVDNFPLFGDSYDDTHNGNLDPFYTTIGVCPDVQLIGGSCWRSLSSPIDGYTYDDMLGPFWTQGFDGSDSPPPETPTGDANVREWDLATQSWVAPGNQSDVITPGVGFILGAYSDDDFDGTDDGFPKVLRLDPTLASGYRDNDPLIEVSTGAGTMADAADDWSLIGNPVEVPIDFDLLTTSGITGTAYVFDRNAGGTDANGNTGNWISWNGTSGDLTDGLISPAQGFFVQNSGSSASVTFEESSYRADAPFYGKEGQQSDVQNIRMELRGENTYSSMWFNFTEEGSFDPVHGDAVKLQPFSHEYAMLATQKSDGDLLDIGRFPSPLYSNSEEDYAIPIHTNTTQPGRYTLTVTRQDLPPGEELYIRDLETGEEFVLDEDFEYEFTIGTATAAKDPSTDGLKPCSIYPEPKKAKSTGEPRFMVTKTKSGERDSLPAQFKLDQNYPNPFNPSTQITFRLPETSNVELSVFDLNGRLVSTLEEGTFQAGTHSVTFNASNLSSGVYIYKLEAGSTVLTRKLTLIK